MPVDLRPYQETMVAECRAALARDRRVLAVAPTGSGKTVMFAHMADAAARKGKRVTITAHRVEIVQQIGAALDRLGVRHGRIQTGHTMTGDAIQVGMVQTIAKRLDLIPEPDLFVPDEAHHAVAGTWAKITERWIKTRILGFTATPERMDGKGLGDAFDAMVLGPSTADLIDACHLARFEYFAPPMVADISALKAGRADYSADAASDAMDKAVVTGDAVSHYQQYLAGRTAIAFCCSVAHAEHVARQFRMAGVRAAAIDGGMDADARRRCIKQLGTGELQLLTSCDLVSEGTDIPNVGGAILLRPTRSLAMFLQQVGRALRPKPDGKPAVILDHVGNAGRHGMPDDPREWSLRTSVRREKDEVAISQCKACYRTFNATAPGWKVGIEPCADQPRCLFGAAEVKAREDLEVVAGELKRIEREDAERIAHIRGTSIARLLTGKETAAELAEVAKIKGYHPRWVHHRMAETGALRR